MERKIFSCVLLLAVLSNFSVFALDITLGLNYHTIIMKNSENYESIEAWQVPEVAAYAGDEVYFAQGHVTGCAEVFADFTYVVIGSGLQFQLPGTWWVEMDINGASAEEQILEFQYDNDLSFLYLNNYLYLKFPFHLGRVVSVYPMAGLQYSFNIKYTYNNYDVKRQMNEPKDLNDWYVAGGFGIDLVFRKFVFRPSFLFSWNLTPGVDERGADEYESWKIHAGFGVGYRL